MVLRTGKSPASSFSTIWNRRSMTINRISRNSLCTLLFGLTFFIATAQPEPKIYITHGYSSDGNGYNVCELFVHPNLDYTFKSYKVPSRREWKNYKMSTPIIDDGKIVKDGDYYIHTKWMNGKPTDATWISKISERKLIFFEIEDNGTSHRSSVYKRMQ